jgi:hypothetical protein
MQIQLISPALFNRVNPVVVIVTILLGLLAILVDAPRGAGQDATLAPMKGGTAFVTELAQADNAGRYTGKFGVHWEGGDDDSWRPGPDNVDLDIALAWAREHAEVVLVSLGGEAAAYSAGARHPDGSFPRWPKDGLVVQSRPSGTPYDGSVQAARWRVDARIRFRAELDAATIVRELQMRLLEDEVGARDVSVDMAGPGRIEVKCEIERDGRTSAVQVVESVLHKTVPQSWDANIKAWSGRP